MKNLILAAIAILGLSIGLANAEPVGGAVTQQSGTQYNVTAGDAGWG